MIILLIRQDYFLKESEQREKMRINNCCEEWNVYRKFGEGEVSKEREVRKINRNEGVKN